jgi:transposase
VGTDERGEIVWHPQFLDFCPLLGLIPLLCPPYRTQTKGKAESCVKYLRFVPSLYGHEPQRQS